MKGLAALCKEHGILFICDEVQSGFGRTGKYFAFEHAGVVPDILVMAKGIASGMPISCVMANAKLTDTLHPGAIGGTYSGNALSCAAAIATIEVFEEEKLLENAAIRGKQLREGLERIKNAHNDKILEVRGRGLMVGFEFKNVPYGFAQSVSDECLRHGMLILRCSSYETLRFIPPLTVTKEEIETGLQIFEDSLKIVM
jgi:4-aminobutyrate aminotransferase